jgi:hypothetical protein
MPTSQRRAFMTAANGTAYQIKKQRVQSIFDRRIGQDEKRLVARSNSPGSTTYETPLFMRLLAFSECPQRERGVFTHAIRASRHSVFRGNQDGSLRGTRDRLGRLRYERDDLRFTNFR